MTISLTPTLINRVVLSLKRAADVNSTANGAWSTEHFSNMRFEPVPMAVTLGTVVGQPPDDPTETLSDSNGHNDIPLDDLIKYARSRSPVGFLGVASQGMV
jgi:hypothetical protein